MLALGTVSTYAGKGTEHGDENGSRLDGRFYSPHGVAFDSRGNLYVADCNNDSIRKITADGRLVYICLFKLRTSPYQLPAVSLRSFPHFSFLFTCRANVHACLSIRPPTLSVF